MGDKGQITLLIACRERPDLIGLDHVHTAQGVIRVVGQVHDSLEVLQGVVGMRPDVLLIDGQAPEFDALNTTLEVSASTRSTGVIVLGGEDSADYLRRAMRAGAKECLTASVDLDTLADAIAEVASIQRQLFPVDGPAASGDGSYLSRVITVCGGKEGVGKTTIAVNLAVALARVSGDRVALLDLAFGDAAVMLNLTTHHGFAELQAQEGRVDPTSLRELMRQHEAGVSVLPRVARLRYLEQDPVDAYVVQDVVGYLREQFRYIVVDNPPMHLESELQSLSLADEVLCVTTPWDILTLRNTRAFLDAAVGTFCPSDRVRLVLNRSDDHAMVSRADVEKALQRTVSIYIPNDARLVASSINVGVPFVISKPESPVSRAIKQFAASIAGVEKTSGSVRRAFALFR
ncbi:MAG TPA: P-loop NTPase [Armatimonadota bacterium]|nr:P-loop NTPase [Armatimonadota bacterium]